MPPPLGDSTIRPTLADSDGRSTDLPRDKRFARRALAAAMVALGRADDPAQVFLENREVIVTSLILLGREDEARALVARFSGEGSTQDPNGGTTPED
jgi:hypothetical protein